MSRQNNSTLKGYFENGDTITETSMANLVDTMFFRAVAIKTTTYLISVDDQAVIANGSSDFTITLPAATGSGIVYTVKNVNTGVVTLNASTNGGTIDGENTASINQWESIDVVDYAVNKFAII